MIELDKLKEHFHEPMADVARKLGVCTTFFKRICRTYGIKRWPFRKVLDAGSTVKQCERLGEMQPPQASCRTVHIDVSNLVCG